MGIIGKKFELLLLMLGLSLVGKLNAGIAFYSDDAKIKLAASGTKLNVANAMTLNNGTFQRVSGTNMTGANIVFNNTLFMQDNSEVFLAPGMTYSPSNIFSLTGGSVFDARETSTSLQGISVSGVDNAITGAPIFHGTNAISLTDYNSTVSLAILSVVNRRIAFNNGRIYLANDLTMGARSGFTGAGSIYFNDNTLNFGGASLVWTATTRFAGAPNVCLNGDVRLSGQMIFDGNGVFNGNGSVLDLSLGGTLRIKANSNVNLNNLKIKGLSKYGIKGTGVNAGPGGSIVLDDPSSVLTLNQAEIELNNNMTFTTGALYVQQASTIGVKNYFLTFDQRGTLSVDGTSLTYEPIQDANNIVSVHTYNVNQINGGIVRSLRANPVSYDYSVSTTLGSYVILSSTKPMNIKGNVTLNGATNFVYCGTSGSPLINVQAGCTLTFKNITLMNFNFNLIKLYPGAKVFFGDGTRIEFSASESLPNTTSNISSLTFSGYVYISGRGQTLDLTDTASIIVGGRKSTLMLDGLRIKNLRGTTMRLNDTTNTFSLRSAILNISSTYTFTVGHIDVLSDSAITGDGNIFSYESRQTASIMSRAMLTVDRNVTFSYSPKSTNKNLISMADITSVLFLNGSNLKTTTTGIQFKKGTLLVDGRVNLYNQLNGTSATSLSQAIVFGDGTAANDANISIMPAASINLQTGLIDYRNAS